MRIVLGDYELRPDFYENKTLPEYYFAYCAIKLYKKSKVKLYLNRVPHSAQRLVSMGALYE